MLRVQKVLPLLHLLVMSRRARHLRLKLNLQLRLQHVLRLRPHCARSHFFSLSPPLCSVRF